MKPKAPTGRSLFDVIQEEEDKEKPECPHRQEEKTETIWPGFTDLRMTWTCKACGHIRGRC